MFRALFVAGLFAAASAQFIITFYPNANCGASGVAGTASLNCESASGNSGKVMQVGTTNSYQYSYSLWVGSVSCPVSVNATVFGPAALGTCMPAPLVFGIQPELSLKVTSGVASTATAAAAVLLFALATAASAW